MTEKEYPTVPATDTLPVNKPTSAEIPHPLDNEWSVSIDDTVYGPFSGHDLKVMAAEGRLEHDTLVVKTGGTGSWIKASDDRALKKFFVPAPQASSQRRSSVSAGDGAQVVTVNNTISTPSAYLGEKPVDKSPFMAAILSLLIVGVGQMYNGEVGKGILMIIGCILLWTIFLGWIINIWAIVDAYSVANRKHDAYDRWMEANAAAARSQAAG